MQFAYPSLRGTHTTNDLFAILGECSMDAAFARVARMLGFVDEEHYTDTQAMLDAPRRDILRRLTNLKFGRSPDGN